MPMHVIRFLNSMGGVGKSMLASAVAVRGDQDRKRVCGMTDEVGDEANASFLDALASIPRSDSSGKQPSENRRAIDQWSQKTDKQLLRRDQNRSGQNNYRCTPDHKALTAKVADYMGISRADVIELAVQELAKMKGMKLDDW